MNITVNDAKQWIKTSKNPVASFLLHHLKAIKLFEIPAPKIILKPCYIIFCYIRNLLQSVVRIFIWTPLFKGRLTQCGKNLYLYGGFPYVSGPVEVVLGSDCRVSAQLTISGRASAPETPIMRVGNNVDIGWLTTIAVGHRVELGDNVRIAGRAFFAGYPGHPINTKDRAAGLPETDNQVGDIILEDDVWIATGVTVTAGVTIGKGTIVAAGSVVTHDLPPMVLAGGMPAKVIRKLDFPEIIENNNEK